MNLRLLALVGLATAGLFFLPSESQAWSTPCDSDINRDGVVNIQDMGSFFAPVYRFNTSPNYVQYDERWDIIPGPAVPGGPWINIQDYGRVSQDNGTTGCPLPDVSVAFYSKLLGGFDDIWDADPVAATALMNANYEVVHTFDCGRCRDYGEAFNGLTLVYQDPTNIGLNCVSDSPGVDCADILLNTSGGPCYQRFFEGSRYLADVTKHSVRDDIVAKAQSLVAEPFADGYYFDVAEAWLPNATPCAASVSDLQWLEGFATLVGRLQTEVDGPLVVNSQYFWWGNVVSLDPDVAKVYYDAPDVVEMEFGWIEGRHGEGTVSGAADKLAYVDYLHNLGTSVFTFERKADDSESDYTASQRDFGLAMHYIQWGLDDLYGTFSQDGQGSGFYAGYNGGLGSPLGPRTSCGSGCYQRVYEAGTVAANVVTKTGTLP